MITILLAFALLSTVIFAMAIGVILGRKPITGSCGGIGAALGEKNYDCDICGGDPDKCDDSREMVETASSKTELFYDATQHIPDSRKKQKS